MLPPLQPLEQEQRLRVHEARGGLLLLLNQKLLLKPDAIELLAVKLGLGAGGGGFAGTGLSLRSGHGGVLRGLLARGGLTLIPGGDGVVVVIPRLRGASRRRSHRRGLAGPDEETRRQEEEEKEERFHGFRFAFALSHSARVCLNVRRISCISASSKPFLEVK